MSILNLEGAYENELVATGEFNLHATRTALMLPSGQRIVVPTELLLHAMETQVPGGVAPQAAEPEQPAAAPGQTAPSPQASIPTPRGLAEEQVIPLVEEHLVVGKREVERAHIRLHRETEEVLQTVQVPLTETHWEVEHVPVEQRVDTQPEVRRVGETMIFPLVEERLVVIRELWLREEVHVRRVSTTVEKSADFAIRRDVLREERTGAA